MTTDQMIADFQEQMNKVVEEIKDLDRQLTAKKEQYFRLQGAIEALNLAKQESSAETPEETTPTEVVQ